MTSRCGPSKHPKRSRVVSCDEAPHGDDAGVEKVERKERGGRGTDRVRELEEELQYTRESLQTTIEELETSNEELTSANEELQSTNEELQSTNEELETSKEELQSLNEESTTVNAELQSRIDDLARPPTTCRTSSTAPRSPRSSWTKI